MSLALLLWGLAGLATFYREFMMPYDQLVAHSGKAAADKIRAIPTWLWWVFGVAVSSGVMGSAALLLRQVWARRLYLISLVAISIQFGYNFAIIRIQDRFGWSSAAFPAFIFATALFQLWFVGLSRRRGWLR